MLTVLACWCKQTVLPFALVPLIFLLLVKERRAAVAYLKWLLLSGTVISLLFVWQFGGRAIWFNMVTIPSRQPLRYGEQGIVLALCRGLAEWTQEAAGPAMPLLALLAIAAALPNHAFRRAATSARPSGCPVAELCRRRPWIVLILAGTSLLLPSVLGWIIVRKLSFTSNSNCPASVTFPGNRCQPC